MAIQEQKSLAIPFLLQREIANCEGPGVLKQLLSPEKGEPFVVYLCSPLQPTGRKSALQHIAEVALKASLIEGATYEGREVKCFIPHTEIFPLFNELTYPQRRQAGVVTNTIILQQKCNALVRIGTRVSSGMKGEITKAKDLGLPIISFSEFKKKLNDLPPQEKSEEVFAQIMKSLRPALFTEEFIKRRSMRSLNR